MIRRMLILATALLLLFSALPAAGATTGEVTYSGNSGKFIFAPGSNYSPTDLFPDLKDVMPGDTLTQQITLKNLASNKVKVRLYIRALGATADSVDFLSQLKLKVIKQTDTVMFDAPANETTGLKDWTYIGTLYSGGKTDLNVLLTVPVELDNRFQDAVGLLQWCFYAEELPIEPTDPSPQTGDTILPMVITLAVSGGAILLILFFERKKRRQNKQ